MNFEDAMTIVYQPQGRYQVRPQENTDNGWQDQPDAEVLGSPVFSHVDLAAVWARQKLGAQVDGLERFRWAVVDVDTGDAIATV